MGAAQSCWGHRSQAPSSSTITPIGSTNDPAAVAGTTREFKIPREFLPHMGGGMHASSATVQEATTPPDSPSAGSVAITAAAAAPAERQSAPPIPRIGVSMLFLEEFVGMYDIQGLTSSQVCKQIINPLTMNDKISFADFFTNLKAHGGSSGDQCGRQYFGSATLFVSHAWSYNFVEVYETLREWWEKNGRSASEYFWLDMFVNNQHNLRAERSFEWWTETFRSSIVEIGKTLVIMLPWENPIYMHRAWCLFEFYTTVHANVKYEILQSHKQRQAFMQYFVNDFSAHRGGIFFKISHIDIEVAKASRLIDEKSIKDIVRSTIGFEKLNKLIMQQMREWIVSVVVGGMEAALDKRSREYLQMQLNLAHTLRHMGRYDDAIALAQANLECHRLVHGEDNVDGVALLALLHRLKGEYKEALRLYDRELTMQIQTHGPRHVSVATVYNNLGLVHKTMRNLSDAWRMYTAALEIYEKVLQPSDPLLASTLSNLGSLLNLLRRNSEAIPILERALLLRQQNLGDNHPDTANTELILGRIYRDEGRFDDAEKICLETLRVFEKLFGPDHPKVAYPLNDMAETYRLNHKFSQALPLYQRALALREQGLGPTHPRVATTLANLGKLYRDTNQTVLMTAALERALEIRRANFGISHPDTQELLVALGRKPSGAAEATPHEYDDE